MPEPRDTMLGMIEHMEDLASIISRIEYGHSVHCARRMVYGDGECECNMLGGGVDTVAAVEMAHDLEWLNCEYEDMREAIRLVQSGKPLGEIVGLQALSRCMERVRIAEEGMTAAHMLGRADVEEELRKMTADRDRLRGEMSVLRGTLRFYADKSSYESLHIEWDDVCGSYIPVVPAVLEDDGEKARAALGKE